VEAWRLSVSAAVDLVRVGGARHVSLVGIRLGATLAASVSVDCKPDALVLWDPCGNGRSYLREQAVLRSVYDAGENDPAASGDAPSTRDAGQGKVETLGTVYGPETVRAMSELTIGAVPDVLAGRVLALLRPDRAPNRSVLDRLSELDAEIVDAPEQEQMLDLDDSRLFVPQPTLQTIVKWLSQNATGERVPLKVPAREMVDMRGPTAHDLTEEIKYLGPNQLFGVLTHPTGHSPAATVVLLNGGTTNHTGPGRLWVDLARSWAEDGIGVLRVDLSGIGDSPPRSGQPVDSVYSQFALEDVADIVEAVSPGAPSAVVLMGLCSGAYHSVRAGTDLGVGGVVAINPSLERQLLDRPALRQAPEPPGWRGATKRTARQARAFAEWKLVGADKRLTRAMGRALGKVEKDEAYVRVVGTLAQRLGGMLWWCASRVSPVQRPAQVLEGLVKQGIDTFVVCARDEATEILRGEQAKLRRLAKAQCFHMVVPGIDHSLLTRRARDRAFPVLTEHIMSLQELINKKTNLLLVGPTHRDEKPVA
jgi:hypothetical protein